MWNMHMLRPGWMTDWSTATISVPAALNAIAFLVLWIMAGVSKTKYVQPCKKKHPTAPPPSPSFLNSTMGFSNVSNALSLLSLSLSRCLWTVMEKRRGEKTLHPVGTAVTHHLCKSSLLFLSPGNSALNGSTTPSLYLCVSVCIIVDVDNSQF